MQHCTLLAALSAPRYVLKKETEPPNLVTGFFVYGHHVGYHPATRRGVASYPRPVDRHDSACHARRARVIVSRRPTRSALQSSRSFWRSLRCSSQRASCPRFPASSSNNSATVSVQVLFSLRCARMITPMLAAYLPRPISANRKAMDASCGFTPGWSPGRCISRPRFIHERRHLVGINSPHHIADAIGADPKPNRDGAPRARRLLRRSEARGSGQPSDRPHCPWHQSPQSSQSASCAIAVRPRAPEPQWLDPSSAQSHRLPLPPPRRAARSQCRAGHW